MATVFVRFLFPIAQFIAAGCVAAAWNSATSGGEETELLPCVSSAVRTCLARVNALVSRLRCHTQRMRLEEQTNAPDQNDDGPMRVRLSKSQRPWKRPDLRSHGTLYASDAADVDNGGPLHTQRTGIEQRHAYALPGTLSGK
jgi:hypothetical protein